MKADIRTSPASTCLLPRRNLAVRLETRISRFVGKASASGKEKYFYAPGRAVSFAFSLARVVGLVEALLVVSAFGDSATFLADVCAVFFGAGLAGAFAGAAPGGISANFP